MGTVPTTTVLDASGREVRINVDDFDPTVYRKVGDPGDGGEAGGEKGTEGKTSKRKAGKGKADAGE